MEVQNLTKINGETESKMELMQKSSLESEEEMKAQLEGEKQKNQALEDEIVSMRAVIKNLQDSKHEYLTKSIQKGEIVDENSAIQEVENVHQSPEKEETTSERDNPSQSQEKEEFLENYSSSFDDNSTSSTSSSSESTSTATSSKSFDVDVGGKDECSKEDQANDDNLNSR